MDPQRKAELSRRIGQEVSSQRRRAGLSQAELGQLIGVAKMRIYRIEHAYVPVLAVELVGIAAALGRRVERFLVER